MNSIFESPEKLFKYACQEGILRILEDGIQCDFKIEILDINKWKNFLDEICKKTNDQEEFNFANFLIKELNRQSNITDSNIEKLRQIETVDELINSISQGVL